MFLHVYHKQASFIHRLFVPVKNWAVCTLSMLLPSVYDGCCNHCYKFILYFSIFILYMYFMCDPFSSLTNLIAKTICKIDLYFWYFGMLPLLGIQLLTLLASLSFLVTKYFTSLHLIHGVAVFLLTLAFILINVLDILLTAVFFLGSWFLTLSMNVFVWCTRLT